MKHRLTVLDHTGDTQHEFDTADALSVERAKAQFDALVARGYTPAAKTGEGQSVKVSKFNPDIQETLFIPRLQGG